MSLDSLFPLSCLDSEQTSTQSFQSFEAFIRAETQKQKRAHTLSTAEATEKDTIQTTKSKYEVPTTEHARFSAGVRALPKWVPTKLYTL